MNLTLVQASNTIWMVTTTPPGFFENSIDKFSTYWGVGHERMIGTDWFGLGILGGVVTGYDGGFSPRLAAVPYMYY